MRPLSFPLLRRIASPLRDANPKLYSRLNGIRRRIITRGRDIAAHQVVALARFQALARPVNARVLEIGSDPELKMMRAIREAGAAEVLGVNNDPEIWRGHPTGTLEGGSGIRLQQGDAAALPFPDASFDHVFSVSVFEHILDLPTALIEMHRVLRPNGQVYSNFGPIWSSGKGHHLRVQVDDEEARHFIPELNPLPDFCHLLLEPNELRRAVTPKVSPRLVDPIVAWVYDDPGINRIFHHQYLEIFQRSPFVISSIVPERDPLDAQLRRILEFKYPSERAFDVTNMEIVLSKR